MRKNTNVSFDKHSILSNAIMEILGEEALAALLISILVICLGGMFGLYHRPSIPPLLIKTGSLPLGGSCRNRFGHRPQTEREHQQHDAEHKSIAPD